MQKIFLTVIDMSIVSSLVILAVLLVRALLKRAPRRFAYVLWAAVLLRLLCPFAVESPLSLIPQRAGELAQSAALPESEQVTFVSAASAAYRAIGDTANGGQGVVRIEVGAPAPVRSGEEAGRQYVSASRGQVWLLLCAWLWPAGTAAVLVWGIVGQIKLRRMLVGAVKLEGDVWLADHIPTAFVMGLVRPKIYLPSDLEGPGRDYVLEHERSHVRRGDHITRLLAFAALALHWFNPLVWLAFAMSGRDMEMSCDEAVMRRSGADIRADYCQTLLDMSANKHFPSPCLLAFGEGDTGARVRNALSWRKPALWAGIGAAVLIAAACVLLLTNPARKAANTVELSFPAYQDGRDAALIAESISLQRLPGTVSGSEYEFVVPGYCSEYGVLRECRPYTSRLTLPEGWTLTSAEGTEDDDYAYGMLPLARIYDGDGQYAGFIAWDELTRPIRANHYVWEDLTLVARGGTDVYTATVIIDEFDESLLPGHPWTSFETSGIYAKSEDLGVYMCIQFEPGVISGDEMTDIAQSIKLEPWAVEYVPGFGGVLWGTDRQAVRESFDYLFLEGEPLRARWNFMGHDCVAIYRIDPDGRLYGGDYSFNEEQTLTLQEQIELYEELLELLTQVYGEPDWGSPNIRDGKRDSILAVIDGDSDHCLDVWERYAPDGCSVNILLELDRLGNLTIGFDANIY